MIGETILFLAGVGVTCGLIGLADTLGIVDVDEFADYFFGWLK